MLVTIDDMACWHFIRKLTSYRSLTHIDIRIHSSKSTVPSRREAAVLRLYTQQTLWIMAAVSKSTVPSRREAAAEIINSTRKGSNQGTPNYLFGQFASLIDHLIRLCFHASQSRSATIIISTEFSALKRMMPTEIIMPAQGSINVNLPTYDTSTIGFFSATDLPTIIGIADEAEVLSSLQRPKKIILLGSDGSSAHFSANRRTTLGKMHG